MLHSRHVQGRVVTAAATTTRRQLRQCHASTRDSEFKAGCWCRQGRPLHESEDQETPSIYLRNYAPKSRSSSAVDASRCGKQGSVKHHDFEARAQIELLQEEGEIARTRRLRIALPGFLDLEAFHAEAISGTRAQPGDRIRA
eukprot:8832138-Pyramimonas_sp.AAC.1